MQTILAPNPINWNDANYYIVLGGSIEMGDAPNWQSLLTTQLNKYERVVLLNPRRDNWDTSRVQSINNNQFREQVEWELNAQEQADLNIYNFCAGYKSPITLLELGLFHHRAAIVCCPDGYWRKGNVEIVCNRYKIPIVNSFSVLIEAIHNKLISPPPVALGPRRQDARTNTT